MPKGEFDTPGPFLTGNHFSGTDNVIVRDGVKGWCLMFADLYLGHMSHTDAAEREELVGLLNKGTHFDGLVGALKGLKLSIVDLPIENFYNNVIEVMSRAEAVIAKAEGKDDADKN